MWRASLPNNQYMNRGSRACTTNCFRSTPLLSHKWRFILQYCELYFYLFIVTTVDLFRKFVFKTSPSNSQSTTVKPSMTTAMTKRHGNLLPQTFVTADSRDRHAAAVTDIVAYFAESYVPAKNDRLSAFQTLCEDLDVEIGTSIKKCKKVL